jgi:toxin FitB
MFVLDTNVLSEPMRASPAPNVTAWLAAQAPALLFTTAVTEAELHYGVALHPDGQRKAALDTAVRAVLALFAARILPFDRAAAAALPAILWPAAALAARSWRTMRRLPPSPDRGA